MGPQVRGLLAGGLRARELQEGTEGETGGLPGGDMVTPLRSMMNKVLYCN